MPKNQIDQRSEKVVTFQYSGLSNETLINSRTLQILWWSCTNVTVTEWYFFASSYVRTFLATFSSIRFAVCASLNIGYILITLPNWLQTFFNNRRRHHLEPIYLERIWTRHRYKLFLAAWGFRRRHLGLVYTSKYRLESETANLIVN